MHIGFFPYTFLENDYPGMMQWIIGQKNTITDYMDLKNKKCTDVDMLYLNWIEEVMDEEDKALIVDLKNKGTKIVWVFHNIVSHKKENRTKTKNNISFLIEISTNIVVLSKDSVEYLSNYDVAIDITKIVYIPHPNFSESYGNIVDNEQKRIGDTSLFTFSTIGGWRDDKNIELLIEAFKSFKYNNQSRLLVVGAPESEEQLNHINELVKDVPNIVLVPQYIPDYSLNFYYEISDIIVLNYDNTICLNSSALMLAFTNKKTVVVSNIAMTKEFDSKQMYIYSYNEDNHIDKLKESMEQAFLDGKDCVKFKGYTIYKYIEQNFSRKKITDYFNLLCSDENEFGVVNREEIARKNIYMLEKWMADIIDNKFCSILADNPNLRIGIYGFGKYGQLLYKELKKNNIRVECIIDKNYESIVCNDELIKCDINNLRTKLDLIIVSTNYVSVNDIREKLLNKKECYVFGLINI